MGSEEAGCGTKTLGLEKNRRILVADRCEQQSFRGDRVARIDNLETWRVRKVCLPSPIAENSMRRTSARARIAISLNAAGWRIEKIRQAHGLCE